jgi:small subunit ribosomal protein S13
MRISGVNLNKNKRLLIALTYVDGIGLSTSQKILDFLKIEKNIRVKDAEEFSQAIQKYINDNNIKTEDERRREVSDNIKRLILIQCYRGKRHLVGLPMKARTRSNANTARRLLRRV